MPNTEALNPRFADIESWTTAEAVDAMLEGQMSAIAAVRSQVGNIARASDAAAAVLRAGGRIIYAGAGTSGRIAVQDGAELGPTFGWPQERLAYVVAGGMGALVESVEAAEDDADNARAEIGQLDCSSRDVVIGIAASGRTPFAVSAVTAARAAGALTIGISNNPQTPLLIAADHPIVADTGSELVAGSTRMKAGTAQKVILNLLSTAVMLRLGRVYHGLMVNMVVSNSKLESRARAMVEQITGCSADDAATALALAGNDIKRAVLIARGLDSEAAAALLRQHDDNLRAAIDTLAIGQ
jgi:N-acetylmuramic acid 6-phosphate etherase